MPSTKPARWPWACLIVAMAWVAVVRVPLVAHAADHLDSDLAVDGITLRDAVDGRWRWHFPGTPHMGIGPMLLAWPQALIWGANPATLVSGGVIAYELVVLSTFLLAWRALGAKVAAWSLVPLAFASTGTVWLAGRLTGGHLLTAAWYAGAFGFALGLLTKGGRRRAAGLGLWCGLGLWLDRMFLFGLIGIAPALLVAGLRSPRTWLAFVLAFAVGYLPHEIGVRVDPHDAYQEQFDPVSEPSVLLGHVRLLGFDCLPRLIAGHRLPGMEVEPSPTWFLTRPTRITPWIVDWLASATTLVALVLFMAAMARLAFAVGSGEDPPAKAFRIGLIGSTAAVLGAFVINRNIFNSDNYRYLVCLLVPGALGFGMVLRALAGRLPTAAVLVTVLFAGLMTLDTARWYNGFGWIGDAPRMARQDKPLIAIERDPDVTHLFGDYWDVYRFAFLSGRSVEGVPYPTYPNRFPGWSKGLGPGRGKMLVIRPDPRWGQLLVGAWRAEGRDLTELKSLTIETWPR